MEYKDIGDVNGHPWNKVTLVRHASRSYTAEGSWCTGHNSSGQYYRRYKENKADVEFRETYWYFENEEDATLFALKFK